ncbi:SDR family oxidoreductase [Companilactobacillus huachuanensis]|uniref:SDR family oxidoreductase n=1 Tax=Companilactobacillus huachuanensis TaxID=2559914 RepID=A0ABW1RP06_9LACO|nr:NmrA family NAD(P)-binding protein [Companilactobacillus huachuanensis]
MKITLLGSLGHINGYVIPELVKQGHQVTVVSHSDKRKKEIEDLGAKAAIGSMQDVEFLTSAFNDADEIYLMISGANQDEDMIDSARQQSKIFKTAIINSGVKHVVDLSSVGADQGPEVGGLYIYHIIEDVLKELDDVTYTFIRPTGFYNNFLSKITDIKANHAIFENRPATSTSIFVDPKDIADSVLKALLNPAIENSVTYVASDIVTGNELVKYVSEKLNMPDLKWIEISDNEMQTRLEKVMPKSYAIAFTKMYSAEGTSKFYADFYNNEPKLGNVKMSDFMDIFANAYQNIKD